MCAMSQAVYAPHEDLVMRDIGGEIIIVPIRGCVGDLDGAYTLNEVAGAIWRRLDGRRTVGELVVALVDAYDVAPCDAERDVAEFLTEMAGAGLVTTRGD
jgi:hypothetical protein